ncbi:MAG: hypothetical protein HFJ37_03910 [Clostridia bacterium]|nr:hypothetical protein [Clostridia bacterium]
MIVAKQVFFFIDKREGTTKDGERYLSLNVLSQNNKKFNFIAKNPKVIEQVSPLNLQRFAKITLVCEFDREFNKERRTSYWNCTLIGVE